MKASVMKIDPMMTYLARFCRRYRTRPNTTAVKARIMMMYTRVFVTSAGFSKARMPWSAKRVERAIATAWLATRIPAIAAIDKNSRRMRGLLPGHASESHRSRDFLDEDLHNGAFRRPRDVDHILVELGDSVALFSDVLDHEFVDLALDEGGFLDFGGLLDGLDGPTRTARVAFEHRDPTFLDEARVWPTT